ncbi:class I SAM-dependent methyltransferase, partial [Candidatus Pelagibacter sp.]|nr:class I SAM-dependent methyltransferase [Candidatus Pelagibacter sp.]
MEEIFKKYPQLKNQNVSRETFIEFELFISMLQLKNDEINIISKKTAKNEVIRERHIIDSAQIIDFVDLSSNIITDIGSGG